MTKPFSYDACPLNDDGTRRAVTRDGREATLVWCKMPGLRPIVGFMHGAPSSSSWHTDGTYYEGGGSSVSNHDRFIPTTRRTIYAVFAAGGIACWYETREEAERIERDNIGEHRSIGVYAVEVEK